MSKMVYAIVEQNSKAKTHIRALGNTAEYTYYTAYLMELSRCLGVNDSKQFAQFYYSYYMNPEWKVAEQYCTRSLPVEKMSWFDPQLTAKLSSYQINIRSLGANSSIQLFSDIMFINSDLFGTVEFKPNFKHLTYLAQVKAVNQTADIDDKYQIVNIIKPKRIWQEQHKFHTWRKIVSQYYYIAPDLNTFTWRKQHFRMYSIYSGAKKKHNSVINSRSHLRHLSPDYTPRNYAAQIKKEYDLPCIPKHMKTRHPVETWDLYDAREGKRWYRHESWKNHKFRHQYEQHLVNYG